MKQKFTSNTNTLSSKIQLTVNSMLKAQAYSDEISMGHARHELNRLLLEIAQLEQLKQLTQEIPWCEYVG